MRSIVFSFTLIIGLTMLVEESQAANVKVRSSGCQAVLKTITTKTPNWAFAISRNGRTCGASWAQHTLTYARKHALEICRKKGARGCRVIRSSAGKKQKISVWLTEQKTDPVKSTKFCEARSKEGLYFRVNEQSEFGLNAIAFTVDKRDLLKLAQKPTRTIDRDFSTRVKLQIDKSYILINQTFLTSGQNSKADKLTLVVPVADKRFVEAVKNGRKIIIELGDSVRRIVTLIKRRDVFAAYSLSGSKLAIANLGKCYTKTLNFANFKSVNTKSSSSVLGIEKFSENTALNSADNDGFISFLSSNRRKIVFLDMGIDASVSVSWQVAVLKACNNYDIPHGQIFNRSLIFPRKEDYDEKNKFCNDSISVHIDSKKDRLPVSSGGTGIATMTLQGFFRVGVVVGPGGRIQYRLIEVESDAATWAAMLNK